MKIILVEKLSYILFQFPREERKIMVEHLYNLILSTLC